jgi:hypothetical protein
MKKSANAVQPARYASQRIGLELKAYFLPLHPEGINRRSRSNEAARDASDYDIIADKVFVN